MTSISLDILRQGGWDLWVLVCVIGAVALLSYLVLLRLWRRPLGWAGAAMIAIGVGGTACIVAIPSLHRPLVGLIWTFVLMSLLSATFYLNLHGQLGTRRVATLLGIRLLALAMLVPMLFEPVLRYIHKPKPTVPLLVLVDASGSMSFPDVQNGPTRIQSAWQSLRPVAERLGEHFVASYFTFSTDLQELKRPEDLARVVADGSATDLAGSLNKAIERSHALKSDRAVFVLISDGIDNATPNPVELIRSAQRPVYTVRVGSEQAEPAAVANVAVEAIDAPDDFVVDHETPVKITVKSTALANRVVDVKLGEVDGDGKPVGTPAVKTLVLQPQPQGQVIEIPFKPKTVGTQRLAAWIDPIAGERSLADNRQVFQSLAMDPRIRVLYIEGRARPEFRDLNRALQRDPNIEAASILRVTTDRFSAAGTVNGVPVSAVPSSLAEWKKFDVVILGDLDSSFLSPFQQGAIEQFAQGGGGVLMIGGQNSFGPGGYQGTPVEKALPVFVGGLKSAQELTPFVPALTAEGQVHPAMEGLADWFGAAGASRKLPPLRGNVVVDRPKAGASVLLAHADRPGPDGKPQIVLAVQRYGEGRSAAFTGDTTYLWYTPLRGMGQDSPYNRFWGQLVRWLAGADVRSRSRGAGVDGLLSKSVYPMGQGVRVRAMVRDDRGDATQFAQVHAMLRGPGKKAPARLALNPVASRNGLYEVMLPPPDKGEWTVELTAAKDGKSIGRQEMKFTVVPPAEEMLKIAANPELLREIARQTRGFHYELAQFPSLVEDLVRSHAPASASRQESVVLSNYPSALLAWAGVHWDWPQRSHLPTQAGLVVALLGAEWALRRRWQLA